MNMNGVSYAYLEYKHIFFYANNISLIILDWRCMYVNSFLISIKWAEDSGNLNEENGAIT